MIKRSAVPVGHSRRVIIICDLTSILSNDQMLYSVTQTAEVPVGRSRRLWEARGLRARGRAGETP